MKPDLFFIAMTIAGLALAAIIGFALGVLFEQERDIVWYRKRDPVPASDKPRAVFPVILCNRCGHMVSKP
jgi:hypothetical protein